MPELPEVETVVREIRPGLVGRRIVHVRASRKKMRKPWSPKWNRLLAGVRIEHVVRRGKWILVGLEDGARLVLHLGMTGQLTVVPVNEPVTTHTHLLFALDSSAQLRFRDVRRFGSASYFTSAEGVEHFFAESLLGPEPFELTADYWQIQLLKTNRCVKAVLLDQRVVAGVGNIYADESLFEAGVHPARIASSLNKKEIAELAKAIPRVLMRAIDKRGSSIRDYIGGNGAKGEFQDEFRAYGRTGEPCVACRQPISRMVLAGRSTHFCTRCQPPKKLTQRRQGAKNQ